MKWEMDTGLVCSILVMMLMFSPASRSQIRFDGELAFYVSGVGGGVNTTVIITPHAEKTRWRERSLSEKPWLPTTYFNQVDTASIVPDDSVTVRQRIVKYEAPDDAGNQNCCIPYGIYNILFIVSDYKIYDDFTLDLRDADWSNPYRPENGHDTHIVLEINTDTSYAFKWYSARDETSGPINSGSDQCIWEWYKRSQDYDSLFVPVTTGNSFPGGKIFIGNDSLLFSSWISDTTYYSYGWKSGDSLCCKSPQIVGGITFIFDAWSDTSDSTWRHFYVDDETDSLAYIAGFDKTIPVPSNFDAGNNGAYAEVTWTVLSGYLLDGYYIERKYDTGNWYQVKDVTDISTNSWTDTEIFYDPGGDPVYYRMRTYDWENDKSQYTLVESIKGDWARKEPAGDWEGVKETFSLQPNRPNPFNPTTSIGYSLAAESYVRLSVYNLLGERIRMLVQGRKGAGFYSVIWDSRDDQDHPAPAGMYIYRLEAIPVFLERHESFTASRKLILTK
jgi:hypothetical protein